MKIGLGAARTLAFGLACALAAPALAQDDGPDQRQHLTDLGGLVLADAVTTRCAVYDDDLTYLTPLQAVAVQWRIEQIVETLSDWMDDLDARRARMRERANGVACGDSELEPYLAYARATARDITDVALTAWTEIEIAQCAYFADDDFMAAVDRAHTRAATLEVEDDNARARYLEQTAAFWISVFERNCYNLAFDPAITLPGQIALALPTG